MNYLERFRKIETFIFDVDGVMTDGKYLITEDHQYLRLLNVRDGYAMKVALRHHYNLAIITGGTSKGVEQRFLNFGINAVYMNSQNKWASYQHYLKSYQVNPQNILYLGDDLPDYKVMKDVGLPCCPFDAVDEIRDIAMYVSPKRGGEGCVRDVIEKVLKLKGEWPGYPDLSIAQTD